MLQRHGGGGGGNSPGGGTTGEIERPTLNLVEGVILGGGAFSRVSVGT